MEFVELSHYDYDEFARTHEHRNFLNSANAFVLQQQYGFDAVFVGVKSQNQILCASGIVFVPSMKSTYAYAQRGFLINYQDKELLQFFTENLVRYLQKKNTLYLKLDPYAQYREHDNEGALVEGGFHHSYIVDNLESLGYVHQGFSKGFDANTQVRWMVVLSLKDMHEDVLLKQLDQQTRWSINKAIKLGVKVREMDVSELSKFKEIMDYASSTRNFDDMSVDHYQKQLLVYGEHAKMMMAYIDTDAMIHNIDEQTLQEETLLKEIEENLRKLPTSKKFLKKQKVQIEAIETCAKRKQEVLSQEASYGKIIPISVAYFVFYEDEIVYVSSGAYDEFRKYNGPYAIQWHMLTYAIKHQYARYNFYGTSGDFTNDADDHGVFEFKKGFHGVVEELVGDFILPIQKGKYRILKSMQGIKAKLR